MLLRHTTLYIILVFALSLGVISCRSTPDTVVQTLSLAEKCMEAHPDSALNLLKSISHPETLHGMAQADYGLLMTQAMDKNYLPLESDSLISIALGYYGSHEGNSVKQGKSFFYYGRVMKELNRPEDAMKYYLKAKKTFDGSNEYKMLGLLSEEMGTLNWAQDMREGVLPNYMDALRYYSLASDTLCMSYALRSIGRYYLSVHGDFDNAYTYYQRALHLAHEHNCNSEMTILQELGLFYRIKKDYKKAEYYLLEALSLDEDIAVFSEIYLSLGYTYLLMNDLNKAESYLKKATEVANPYTQSDAYKSLYKLEKQRRNPWKAIYYKEKSDSINSINQRAEIKKAVAELQKKYEYEKLQKENLQLKIKNQRILILCILFFFMIFLSLLFFYYKHRHHQKKIKEIERQITLNREEIALYQEELVNYQQLQSESEDYRSKIGELNGKVLLLQSQNKTLAERLDVSGGSIEGSCSPAEAKYISVFRMLLALKAGTFKRELSRADWVLLFDLFNFLYLDMVIRLQKEYPILTKHDLEICCLLKFGFTNDALKRVFFATSDAITKAKGRLKKRLNVSPQDDLERFIRNY